MKRYKNGLFCLVDTGININNFILNFLINCFTYANRNGNIIVFKNTVLIDSETFYLINSNQEVPPLSQCIINLFNDNNVFGNGLELFFSVRPRVSSIIEFYSDKEICSTITINYNIFKGRIFNFFLFSVDEASNFLSKIKSYKYFCSIDIINDMLAKTVLSIFYITDNFPQIIENNFMNSVLGISLQHKNIIEKYYEL